MALLPRPLLAIAGLGFAGTMAIRRSNSQRNMDDGEEVRPMGIHED